MELPELNIHSYNAKTRRKMLLDRNPMLAIFVDKLKARDYISEKIGSEYLTTIYQVAQRASEMKWNSLPREFVCKVNHASGGIVTVSESADPHTELPSGTDAGWVRHTVHPDRLDHSRLNTLVDYWLSMKYTDAPHGHPREWAYQDVQPKVFAEELLINSDGTSVSDYKFNVMNGRVRMIQVEQPQSSGPKRFTVFDAQWQPFDVHIVTEGKRLEWSNPIPPRPANLALMSELAVRLASDEDFMRVDMFIAGKRIIVGELTIYPGAGAVSWDPPYFDNLLGSWWRQDY